MNTYEISPNDHMLSRFFSRVVRRGKCWIWIGAAPDGFNGYGCFSLHKKEMIGDAQQSWRAHRASYAIFNGPIKKGLLVCHECDTPLCVNPWHLFLGTTQENTADRDAKGRQASLPRDAGPQTKMTSDKCMEAVELHYLHGLTHSQISKILGCSPSSVGKGILAAKSGALHAI